MRELPILVSAPMVRANLEGRKTVTRRVVKPQPSADHKWQGWCLSGMHASDAGKACWGVPSTPNSYRDPIDIMPPYEVGDRLYVREAWRVPASLDARSGKQIAEDCIAAGYRAPWCPIKYEADGALNSAKDWQDFGSTLAEATPGRYRHARFMPRWASRITLEVTAVRVERLQDITEEQARAEGLLRDSDGWRGAPDLPWFASPVAAFRSLWESINGASSWADNPWVWVVEFKRIDREARAA